MNCINHPDRERSAFCQICGKPLCDACARRVGSAVYCEEDLAARLAGNMPPTAASTNPYADPAAPLDSGEPKPWLALMLGFIPGVGAMYNGQFAKGLLHIAVFAVLVSFSNNNGIFGLFVAGWMAYMVIEAYQTAIARRDGKPLPNAFGLNDLSDKFSQRVSNAAPYTPPSTSSTQSAEYVYTPPSSTVPPAQGAEYAYAPPQAANPYAVPPVPPPPYTPYTGSRLPSGAVWMIVLGIFFLLGTSHRFPLFHAAIFWPLMLIVLGVFTFIRRAQFANVVNDGTTQYKLHLLHAGRGAFWMVLTGVLLFLHISNIFPLQDSWPFWMIFAGVWMFIERMFTQRVAAEAYVPPTNPVVTPPPAAPGTAIVPQTYEADKEEGR